MNRVINDPDLVVEDMLHGWLIAHKDTIAGTDNPRVVKRSQAPERGKVGIVTGGGSGHAPAFLGYVGDGLVDAVAIGEIFSSPTAKSFLDAIRYANGGAGVACLYGNYAGDNMNVRMATDMAEMMLAAILPDLPFVKDDRVAILVSGLGATPIVELYILYGEIAKILARIGIEISFNQVGNLFTSLEMMGVTLTVMKLDDELLACMKHPCDAVGHDRRWGSWHQYGKRLYRLCPAVRKAG